MKKYPHVAMFLIVIVSIMSVIGGASYMDIRHGRAIQVTPRVLAAPLPQPDAAFSQQYIASMDVARVFGRASGCADADVKLIDNVASEALKAGIDPRVLAATVAVESGCNQYATSTRGSIGLLQITPRTWRATYDFDHTYNLLNAGDNLRVGAMILSGFIKQYGLVSGLRHYNGMGVGCDTCDAGYTEKITALAARR